MEKQKDDVYEEYEVPCPKCGADPGQACQKVGRRGLIDRTLEHTCYGDGRPCLVCHTERLRALPSS